MEEEYHDLIEQTFHHATSGLKPEWFNKPSQDWYRYVTSLPVHLKITYLVSILDRQVSNGGFDQYFANGYGQFSAETISALLKINAGETAEVLIKAYSPLRELCNSDEEFRNHLLARPLYLLDRVNGLDDLYAILDDVYDTKSDNLEYLLGIYLYSVSE
jgi:hypothetical protein